VNELSESAEAAVSRVCSVRSDLIGTFSASHRPFVSLRWWRPCGAGSEIRGVSGTYPSTSSRAGSGCNISSLRGSTPPCRKEREKWERRTDRGGTRKIPRLAGENARASGWQCGGNWREREDFGMTASIRS